jgi:hypothetical protein
MDAADIWEGPELLEIFADRLGLDGDTLKIYQLHFEAVSVHLLGCCCGC